MIAAIALVFLIVFQCLFIAVVHFFLRLLLFVYVLGCLAGASLTKPLSSPRYSHIPSSVIRFFFLMEESLSSLLSLSDELVEFVAELA